MNPSMQTNKNSDQEITIDLVPLFQALLKRFKLIILITVIGGVLGYFVTMQYEHPTYQSSFTLYINGHSADLVQGEMTKANSSEISLARSLAPTYAGIITGRTVLQNAAAAAGLNYSYGQLSNMVKANIVGNTEIITVSVTTDNAVSAKALADQIAVCAAQRISEIVDGTSMRVIDEPQLPAGTQPNYRSGAIKGAVISFVLVCAVIVLITLLDTRIKSEEALESRFGVTVLATVPNLGHAVRVSGGNNGYYGYYGYGSKSNAKADKKNEKKGEKA